MTKADRTGKKKTEENYIRGLRDALPDKFRDRIVIKVFKANTQDLVKKCMELESLSFDPQFRQLWIIFDRDEVKEFDKIISAAEREDIYVGWSNPCIEIWFDAYFGAMHSYPDSKICCGKFAETFAKKTKKEYHKDDDQIYATLFKFGDENHAIEVAEKRLQEFLDSGITKPSDMCPCSTVYKLIADIHRKTK